MNKACKITFDRYSLFRGELSTGIGQEIMPSLSDISNRSVILIEDIVDTGLTMQHVMNELKQKGIKSVKLATLLFKPDSLKCELKPDYIGFEIPSLFVVGHGLDYDERGRAYRDIYQIKNKTN